MEAAEQAPRECTIRWAQWRRPGSVGQQSGSNRLNRGIGEDQGGGGCMLAQEEDEEELEAAPPEAEQEGG